MSYLQRHLDSLKLSINQVYQNPLANLLIFAVIGIALALPASFSVILQNISVVTQDIKHDRQLSLFLKPTLSTEQINSLMHQLQARADVAQVNYISKEQGLQELAAQGDLQDILQQLPQNPLPAVLVVYPTLHVQTVQQMQTLLNELQRLPQVDSAKLDMQWIQRLFAMINLAQHVVVGLIILLGLAVVLVISNTIRLTTQHRHQEIEVLTLIGATRGFIRRPFLYTGVVYGVAGALVAWLIVWGLIFTLATPVAQLSQLYHTMFRLQYLSLGYGVSLLVLGAMLGWLGSWLTVSRYLANKR